MSKPCVRPEDRTALSLVPYSQEKEGSECPGKNLEQGAPRALPLPSQEVVMVAVWPLGSLHLSVRMKPGR